MRTLLLSTWFPDPPDNGSKLRAHYLLRALAAQHDVTAVAFRPPSSSEQDVDGPTPNKQPVTAVPDDPFRHVTAPQWVKYLSPSPLAFRASPAMKAALMSLADRKWDAVVAVQMPVAQYALQVTAHARIIDIDTALTFQMRERYMAQARPIARASAWVSWQKAFRYERRMLRRFQAAAVVSHAEVAALQAMVEANRCKVVLISNGVDCCHNRPGLAATQPGSLVYNGSLTYSVNYDAMRWFLAEIYPRIKAQVPGVSLAITGSTRGVDLAGLALDGTVRLTGFVPDVRLPVAEAAVCVVPIRQGGGTRLKILEAMALGTPVVATSKGAEGLDVVDGEHLLLADNPGAFANRTMELLSSPDLRQRLIANARRLVEGRYDWQSIGAHFVNLVEETVRKGKRGTG
jgi:glycosyltransferase involved in cell wall biosynthesis